MLVHNSISFYGLISVKGAVVASKIRIIVFQMMRIGFEFPMSYWFVWSKSQ